MSPTSTPSALKTTRTKTSARNSKRSLSCFYASLSFSVYHYIIDLFPTPGATILCFLNALCFTTLYNPHPTKSCYRLDDGNRKIRQHGIDGVLRHVAVLSLFRLGSCFGSYTYYISYIGKCVFPFALFSFPFPFVVIDFPVYFLL